MHGGGYKISMRISDFFSCRVDKPQQHMKKKEGDEELDLAP